ncbi:MAG: hypothetical protein PHT69_03050 [Bacteroidales bacterium]|nr:hypothetical protein [Bacteroidales bacterium]
MYNLNQFIDERNSELWNTLNSEFNIRIEPSKNQEYSCFTQNNDAILYVDENNICKDSFTHELLHIHLKEKEFYLGSSLKLTIAHSRILSRMLSEALIEHIGNCLDHLKMFEIYKNLGFRQEKFLLDFYDYKCTEFEINDLSRNYKIGNKINTNAVDFYIGKLVAILCDPNIENDYQKPLTILKKLDAKLYSIVEKLIEDTKSYNLNNEDIFVSYRDISNDFYSNLITWMKNNKIA